MVNFGKNNKKAARIVAGVICVILIAGMVIGLLV